MQLFTITLLSLSASVTMAAPALYTRAAAAANLQKFNDKNFPAPSILNVGGVFLFDDANGSTAFTSLEAAARKSCDIAIQPCFDELNLGGSVPEDCDTALEKCLSDNGFPDTNIQKFTTLVMGATAKPVFDRGGGNFNVEGFATFNDKDEAIRQSCDFADLGCNDAKNALEDDPKAPQLDPKCATVVDDCLKANDVSASAFD